MKKYMELNGEKFWRIVVDDDHCVTIYIGSIGSIGKKIVNCYGTYERAQKIATRSIESKLKKGYIECEDKENHFEELEAGSATAPRELPDILKKLNSIEIDYLNEEEIDYEPYEYFLSEEETSSWIKAWTGNIKLDGSDYLIFGQDSTGGYVAIWCEDNVEDILNQPIVFFGSEGEIGVVARNIGEYAWLLAGGFGPYEAAEYPEEERDELPLFIEFAEDNFPLFKDTPQNIISKANSEYPNFTKYIDALCN